MSYSVPKLKDPSLFVGKNYVDGQWIESVSGKRFDVHGMSSNSSNHHIYSSFHLQTQPAAPSSVHVPNL